MTDSTQPLHIHVPRPHTVQHATERHRADQQHASFNRRLAIWITKNTSTMVCAYIFAGIGIGSLVGVFTDNAFLAATCGALSSYFLQLVMLPVINVGNAELSRHTELQSDEQFKATTNTLHDSEQTILHLNAQDAELLKQTVMLQQILDQILALLAAQQIPATPIPSETSESKV